MSLYNGPPRPGARGGKDQFSWENVKSDKDREFYLGHSVKASVGRWQKGKDIFWYAREKQDGVEQAVQDELSLVKAREEELMMEALGLKPKTIKPKEKPQLDQREMKQLMEGLADEIEGGEGDEVKEADQVKGIGFRSGQVAGSGEAGHEMMAGVGVSKQQILQVAQQGRQQLPPPPQISAADLKRLQKSHKKEERKLKKLAKKEAKLEAKKERKVKRRKHKQRDMSDTLYSGTSDESPVLTSKHRKQASPCSVSPNPRQEKDDRPNRDLRKTSESWMHEAEARACIDDEKEDKENPVTCEIASANGQKFFRSPHRHSRKRDQRRSWHESPSHEKGYRSPRQVRRREG